MIRLLSRVILQGQWHSGHPLRLVSVAPRPAVVALPAEPDPFEVGFEAGLAQGLAQARAEGQRALEQALAQHRAEQQRERAATAARWEAVQTGMCAVIARLVTSLVGEALRDPQQLARRVEAALAEIAPGDGGSTIRVAAGAGDPPPGMTWQEDARLGPGDFWVQAGPVEVDGHLEQALGRLEERLLEELPGALVGVAAGEQP